VKSILSLGPAYGQEPRSDALSYNPLNSNTSNASSLLWHALHALPSPSNHTNWAGFYVFDHSRAAAGKKPQLILGPFQGKVACQVIAFGRGVCGVAAATAETQNVPDVDLFPGHIACDGASKSEIVAPIVVDGKVSFFRHAATLAVVKWFVKLTEYFP
jgi:putative methionine-R-sulfoxide reductase with GAF domain